MKASKKQTPAEAARIEARKAAEAAQKMFDSAWAAAGTENMAAIVYNGVMDEAILEDAARSMDRAHSAANRINGRIEMFAQNIEIARERIAKFTADLMIPGANPTFTTKWADSMFEAAAQVAVYSTLLPILKAHGFEGVHETATQEALRGARSRPSSTSSCSNLTEACTTEVWAKVAEDVRFNLARS